MGYRSMLTAVFHFQLPGLFSHLVLRDLLRSFRIAASCRPLRPPTWDLAAVLTYLNSAVFEPLRLASLRSLTKKVLFLLALATAKRVGEIQALSRLVSFVGADPCVSYVPEFVAKTESLSNPIPRSFLVKSLSDFAAGLHDELCPVRALRIYLDRTASFSPLSSCLFLSPRRPTRALSKNAVSFFLREVIHEAEAGRPEVGPVRAHSIRGVSTSAAFHRNWSVASVLESATWCSNSVFVSFYLRDLQHEFDGISSLGPFIAAGSRIGLPSPLPTLCWGRRRNYSVPVPAVFAALPLLQVYVVGPALHIPVAVVGIPIFFYYFNVLFFLLFYFIHVLFTTLYSCIYVFRDI